MSETAPSTAAKSVNIWPWATGVLMLSGLAVIAAIYWQKNVRVQDMEVSGLYYTELAEVEKIAAVPAGVKPDSLDLTELSRKVESLDYIRIVIPYIEPSGDLRLDITEREPLALLVSGSNRVYVDAEGVKLNIIEGKTKNVPIVYGFNTNVGRDTLKSEEFKQISDFLQLAKKDRFGWTTISEVAFDTDDGVVALSHENGVKLVFGRNEFESKLQNWKAFYTQIVKTKGIEQMQQVDLRFTNQVVTREI